MLYCTCTAFCVRSITSQELYPFFQYAHDGIAFMKTLLKNRGLWSGPLVDVSRMPLIQPPTKRMQNQYVIAQARTHA